MYTRVKKDRIFEVPACEQGNSKIQNNLYFLNFSTPLSAEFHRSQYKKSGVFKQNYVILCPFFYAEVCMFRKYTQRMYLMNLFF